jgi:hypothetical protein
MFAGCELQRNNNVTQTSGGFLKLPEFYSLSQEDKLVQWKRINNYQVVSCHRQFGFDFNTIEPVTVISVQVNDRNWLYNRVKEIQWKQNDYDLGNLMLKKIKERLLESELNKLVESDYQSWAKTNVLTSDDILPFESILDGSINEWANKRQLTINDEYLDLIRNEVTLYQ